jgi:hypothetical protein
MLAVAMTFRAHVEGNQRTVTELPARTARMPLGIRQSAKQGTPYTAALESEIEEYNAKLSAAQERVDAIAARHSADNSHVNGWSMKTTT